MSDCLPVICKSPYNCMFKDKSISVPYCNNSEYCGWKEYSSKTYIYNSSTKQEVIEYPSEPRISILQHSHTKSWRLYIPRVVYKQYLNCEYINLAYYYDKSLILQIYPSEQGIKVTKNYRGSRTISITKFVKYLIENYDIDLRKFKGGHKFEYINERLNVILR